MSTPRKAVSGLRRSVLDGKSRSAAKRGGGWKGSWRDRYDIPKAEEEDILLTRGAYENPDDVNEKTGELGLAHFHTCQMHGLKLKPKGPGSYLTARCNIDAKQQDCLACKAQAEGDRRVGLKPTFSFNIIHFGLYERVPLERDGRVVKYEDGENRGKPIMVWERVERPSDHKRIMKDLPTLIKNGSVCIFQKRYIEVGGGHRDDLAQIDAEAAKYCRCGGDLIPIRFSCEKCEEVLADVEEDDMGKKEVAAFAESRGKCKDCGHIGVPVPECTCSDCKRPSPLTAFDVVATVKKEGEGTNSHIVVKRITPLDQYRMLDNEYAIEFEKEGKDYFPKVEDDAWVFVEDMGLRKAATSQWNFEEVHAPKDHGFIAEKLGIRNPFPATEGKDKYKRYGGGGGKSDEDTRGGRGSSREDEPDDDDRRGPRSSRDEDDEPPRRRRERA